MSEGACLFLLGVVRCEVDGAEHLLHGEQPRILLTVLGWQQDMPVTGDELSEAIWGTDPTSYSAASLRKVVSKVRSFLSDSVGEVTRVENIGGCYRCTSHGSAQIDIAVATDSLARADALRRDGRIEDALKPAGRATDLLPRAPATRHRPRMAPDPSGRAPPAPTTRSLSHRADRVAPGRP
ncbi:MAG: hypothetical protein V9E94_12555 [Microthrixaceae bacterium]